MQKIIRKIAFLFLCLSVFGFTAVGARAEFYTITELPPLSGNSSYAYDVHDNGFVVGSTPVPSSSSHAYRWTQAGGMQDLGVLGDDSNLSGAYGVNSLGNVVGWSQTDVWMENRGFYWTPTGGMQELATLGGTVSHADALNDSNVIAGMAYLAGGGQHACIWTDPTGLPTGLPTFPGGDDYSQANDITNSGKVVGWAKHSSGDSHAFLWEGGALIDLGTLGGDWSNAQAVNESLQIVGRYENAGGATRAFLWEGGPLIDLGTLGGNHGQAADINESGVIVGTSRNAANDYRPFIYKDGVMSSLSSLVINGGAWDELQFATAISDSGLIVGQGMIGGKPHAFLLTPQPIPVPSTLLLMLTGIVGMVGLRKRLINR